MSMGSALEVEYLLLLSSDLTPDEHYASLNSRVVEVKRMLSALMQTVRF